MSTAPARRARGRPRVPDDARKRNNVTIRMRDELKSRIQAAAAAQRRSLSDEIETRLERSLQQEEQVGGTAMLGASNLMAGAFLRGGQLGAAAIGHPDWTPEQWMNDATCYRAAAYAVADALGLPLPTSAPGSDPAAVHELMTQMISRGVPIRRTVEGKEDQ